MKKQIIIISASLSLALGAAQAADVTDYVPQELDMGSLPAVSAINGKIEGGYVHYDLNTPFVDSANGYLVQGAVSVPLGHRFGLQVDAGYQKTDIDLTSPPFPPSTGIDVSSTGIGGHLFWRDPSMGLIGAYAHYEKHQFDLTGPFVPVVPSLDVTNIRYGAEGEYYHNDWTVKAFAGGDHLDFGGIVDQTYFAGQASVGFYINENALVTVGVDHSFEQTSAAVGLEAMWDTGNQIAPVFYANANFGENITSFKGGVRVMFGPSSKSLKRRHREDDPEIFLFNNFSQLGSCVGNTTGFQPPKPPRPTAVAAQRTVTASMEGPGGPEIRCEPRPMMRYTDSR